MTDPSVAANRRPITIEAFTAAITAAVETRGRDFVYPKGTHGWSATETTSRAVGLLGLIEQTLRDGGRIIVEDPKGQI